MPFKSEAQRRYMHAAHPEMAKRWEKETKAKDLPEKIHPGESVPRSEYAKRKKSKMTKKAHGMFFEKRAKPRGGRFFNDLAGRSDGKFHEKTAMSAYAQGTIPSGAGANVSPAGAGSARPPMYGAGSGSFDPSRVTGADAASVGSPDGLKNQMGGGLANPVGIYGTGKGREKKAYESPTTPESESGYPTGFHRPSHEQPEALETGVERFHSTHAKGPEYGAGTGPFKMSTTPQAYMRSNPGTGGQVGKHAMPMYLGTSYALEKDAASASDIASNVWDTGRKAGIQAWDTSKKALGDFGQRAAKKLEEKSKDPAYALGALGVGALGAGLLARGVGRAGFRGAKRLVRGKAVAPPTLTQRVGSKIKGMFS